MAKPATPQSNQSLEPTADALQQVCQQLVGQHQRLLQTMQKKRQALRDADADTMSQLCQLEHQAVQQVSELEKQRLDLAGQMTLLLEPNATQPIKLGQLADRLDEPARGRLLVMRQQLLEAMQAVREESSLARRATDSLVNHLTGLLRGVTAASTGVSTYGRTGSPPRAAQSLSTINLSA